MTRFDGDKPGAWTSTRQPHACRATALQGPQGQFSADRLQTLALPRMLRDSRVVPTVRHWCIVALVARTKACQEPEMPPSP